MPDPVAVAGEAASSALRASLDEVASLVSFLRAQVGRVPVAEPGTVALENEADDGMWLSCDGLIARPERLARVVRASGVVIGTGDPMVAASIFVQGYAYRVLALAVACMATSGVVPDSSADVMAIGLSRGRPARVAYRVPAALSVSGLTEPAVSAVGHDHVADEALHFLIERGIDHHLRPLITGVRQEIRVGERLLWGNVAASAATAFRTMEGCLGRRVVGLGTRFFELAPAELDRQGSYLMVEHHGRHGWFWERTNCCLYDHLPGGIRCSDCSRPPRRARRAAYEASLVG